MKKSFIMSAIALLSVFTLSMTSCSDDDDPVAESKIEFKDAEFGHHNSKTAFVGKDIHLECEIASESKITAITASLKDKDGKTVATKNYTDSKYIGVLNVKFHEHLHLSADIKEGDYRCIISVTNERGTTKTLEENIKLTMPEANAAPAIHHFEVNTPEAKAGGKITLTAHIETTAPIAEIEVEFHGEEEYPVEVEDFNGKSGKVDFKKEITVPAECTPGSYHIHLTVKDKDGKATTVGIPVFTITK